MLKGGGQRYTQTYCPIRLPLMFSSSTKCKQPGRPSPRRQAFLAPQLGEGQPSDSRAEAPFRVKGDMKNEVLPVAMIATTSIGLISGRFQTNDLCRRAAI